MRKTLSFSKKLANHIGMIKYFICHYNLALHVYNYLFIYKRVMQVAWRPVILSRRYE